MNDDLIHPVLDDDNNSTNNHRETSQPEDSNFAVSIQNDDYESEYEYEDDDAPFVSGFLESSHLTNHAAMIEDEEPKWREPTREAVTMSLRAEQESTGSKRRLASDLYRIMNQDTQKAGFSLRPSSEDSMDNWTIQLFQFDEDSNLAKDLLVLGLESVELEMAFPEQYPFAPPFVRVVKPRFKKQTGFVMNGALCMELLTNEGWNPINDIESVIVSIRSLLVVGDGRVEAAAAMTEKKYQALLTAAQATKQPGHKRKRVNSEGLAAAAAAAAAPVSSHSNDSYSVAEAQSAYNHLSEYHKKKGWDTSGWWARKG